MSTFTSSQEMRAFRLYPLSLKSATLNPVSNRVKVRLALVTVMFGGLAACSSKSSQGAPATHGSTANTRPSTSSLSDYLHLDQTNVVAGRIVNGDLVVYNPGKAFKIYTGCLPM
jgi:hypothetical protein